MRKTITEALDVVSAGDLAKASGVSVRTCQGIKRRARLPNSSNRAAVLEALRKLTKWSLRDTYRPNGAADPAAGLAPGKQQKLDLDNELARLKLDQVKRENAARAGELIRRGVVTDAHRAAGVEMRRGGEQMRRELARLVPETHRDVFLGAWDAEWSRVRERVARALVVS